MKLFSTIFIFIFLPVFVFAATCNPSVSSPELCNPIQAEDLPGLIKIILNYFGIIIGGASIAMIVFGGLRLVISQGDSEGVSKAKESLTWTITGFILAILAFVIIAAVQNFIGARSVPENAIETPTGIFNPIEAKNFPELMALAFKNFLGIAGVIAVLMLVIAGVRYITSAGNDEQAQQGKEGIKWAVAGIIVIFLAYVIISAVANFFTR